MYKFTNLNIFGQLGTRLLKFVRVLSARGKNAVNFNYQEVRYCRLSRDWAGLKWRPVHKVWEQLQDKRSEKMQNSYR